VSYIPAVMSSVPDPSATTHRPSRLPQHNCGVTFLLLLVKAIKTGVAVVDDGGKGELRGIVVAHWLSGWEAMPLYPTVAYALVEQLAAAESVPLGSPEQIWSDLEQAGLLTRAWNGQPLTVRWRGVDLEAFILPLIALSLAS